MEINNNNNKRKYNIRRAVGDKDVALAVGRDAVWRRQRASAEHGSLAWHDGVMIRLELELDDVAGRELDDVQRLRVRIVVDVGNCREAASKDVGRSRRVAGL